MSAAACALCDWVGPSGATHARCPICGATTDPSLRRKAARDRARYREERAKVGSSPSWREVALDLAARGEVRILRRRGAA